MDTYTYTLNPPFEREEAKLGFFHTLYYMAIHHLRKRV